MDTRSFAALSVVILCLGCAACSSPSAPSQPAPVPQPPPAANLRFMGELETDACTSSGTDQFVCRYLGHGENVGTGCAANVRGTLQLFRPKPFADTVLSTVTFTYGSMIRPGEQFAYRGEGLLVNSQEIGNGIYVTTFQWDSIPCQ